MLVIGRERGRGRHAAVGGALVWGAAEDCCRRTEDCCRRRRAGPPTANPKAHGPRSTVLTHRPSHAPPPLPRSRSRASSPTSCRSRSPSSSSCSSPTPRRCEGGREHGEGARRDGEPCWGRCRRAGERRVGGRSPQSAAVPHCSRPARKGPTGACPFSHSTPAEGGGEGRRARDARPVKRHAPHWSVHSQSRGARRAGAAQPRPRAPARGQGPREPNDQTATRCERGGYSFIWNVPGACLLPPARPRTPSTFGPPLSVCIA